MSCMALESIEDLEELCEVAKKFGISTIKIADVEIAFHQPQPAAHNQIASDLPVNSPSKSPKEEFDDLLYHSVG